MFGERLRQSEEQLPIGFVKNHILEVSQDFSDLPVKKVGESMPFAFMLHTGMVPKESLEGGVERTHRRLVRIENTFVTDKDGLRWEDIHVKGAGYTPPKHKGERLSASHWFKKAKSYEGLYYGLNSTEDALLQFRNAKRLEDMGVRTERILYVAELEELMDDDGPKAISYFRSEEAPPEFRLDPDFVPGVAVRALRTNTRLNQISGVGLQKDRVLAELQRAMRLVAEELRDDAMRESPERFTKWFAETLGRDLGTMHKNGFVHRWLHGQNVTLDARIVDTLSVRSKQELEARVSLPEDMPFRDYSFDQFVEKDVADLRAAVLVGVKRMLDIFGIVTEAPVEAAYGAIFDAAYAAVLLT